MCYYNFKLFSEKHPAFSVNRLRHIYFNRDTNGSAFAFKKVGRSVFVAESKILKWIDLQNENQPRLKITNREIKDLEFLEFDNRQFVEKSQMIEWAERILSSKITAYLVTK